MWLEVSKQVFVLTKPHARSRTHTDFVKQFFCKRISGRRTHYIFGDRLRKLNCTREREKKYLVLEYMVDNTPHLKIYVAVSSFCHFSQFFQKRNTSPGVPKKQVVQCIYEGGGGLNKSGIVQLQCGGGGHQDQLHSCDFFR